MEIAEVPSVLEEVESPVAERPCEPPEILRSVEEIVSVGKDADLVVDRQRGYL